MNSKNIVLAAVVLIVSAASIFSQARTLPATNCRKVSGNIWAVNNFDGTSSGVITQGGKLNGTILVVDTSDISPTPAANVFSFTDDLTLTTNQGVLRTHNVTVADFTNWVAAALDLIDPNTSTGEFAGATGVLYVNARTRDGLMTFQEEISGEICYAN